MKSAFDQMKEGPNGAIVVSWYVSQNGEEPTDDAAEAMNLSTPLECVFVAHRVFQYADNGSEPFPQGVLCVLRDTDDNCSESVLYLPGSNLEPSLSPYCEKEGFHYLPENASQVMQLNTEKKLGHILVCVPKKENTTEAEEEELLVVGAVPVDFSKLHRKGNVVLFIESKSKDDAVWGEISLEWLNTSQDAEKKPAAIDVDKESLFVNVVRGLNLINRDGQPVSEAYVSVAAGEMEGFTVMAPNVAEGGDDTHVITWNQEIRFMDVDPKEENLEVVAFENGNPISTGFAYLKPEEDEAVVVVQMHDMYKEQEERGEIIVNFKRLHVNDGGATRALESESEQNAAEDSDREAAEEEAEHATSQEPESAVDSDKESEEAQEEQHENDEEEAAAEEAQDEEEEQEEAQDRALEDDQQQQEEEAEEEENDTHEDGDDEESEKESAAAAEEEEEEKQEDSAHEEEKEEEEAHHSDEEQDNQDDHESDAEEEKQEESAEHNEEEEEENHSEEQNQAEEEDDDHNRASEDENKENKEDEEDKENDEDSEDHQDRDASEEEKHEEPAEEGDDNQHDGEDEDQDGNDDKEQHDDDDQQEEDQESHKGETNDNEEEEGAADQNDADENEDAAGDAQEAEEGEAGGSDGAEEDAAEPKEPQQDGLDQASEGKPESDYQPDDKAVSPSPAPQPRRSSKPVWSDSRKSRGYQQPWYPAGRPNNDSHLPYEKTQRSEKSKENIKELERRRERLEEESMRRGSTPRSSLSTPH
ncbi:hypothetical protein ADEAN_000690300 [Angomonas deanei]|uniref:Uncharacterized protein n=1 Tax=Angomonas deanei TaxID=59799 RepID=A0A7G2CHS1_9TRYP|nr:hypothetical protein ADEAN_000690300 [Angomonas deanei]